MKKSIVPVIVLAAAIGMSPAVGAASSKPEPSQAELRKEAKISMNKARSIALKKVPGKVSSAELERENGKLIYSFDIKTGKGSGVTEVNVDAITGDVATVHEETPATEAAEKKQKAKEKKTPPSTATQH